MFRRVFPTALALVALVVSACGHQVTPSPTGSGDLSGHMVVRFRTNGAFNFNQYVYAIVIDTCGNGMPYPDVYNGSFFNYSFSFLIGGAYGTTYPVLEQYILTPGTGNNNLNPQNVPLTGSLVNYNPNSNSLGTEFELTFDRALLDNPKQANPACPNQSPAPSSAPTPTLTPTPTASPTATASASSGPTASPTPVATSAFGYSTTWYINFFTLQGAQPIDSLGVNGAMDKTFSQFTIDTTQPATNVYNRPAGSLEPSDPQAQLAGGEIDNYP